MMIFKYRQDKEVYTSERCYINELYNSETDIDCSIARARVEPGVTTELHALQGIVERYVILQGVGRVEIQGSRVATVEALDVVSIPAGESQRITNVGEEDLVFLAVCTPRFTPDSYSRLEV